jgi:bifunctional polynucleotide phosphatase/kinase
MSPVIYNLNNATLREKMAAFDYDWTLVCPKNGKTFPSNIDDWEWLYPSIPNKLKNYYENGYMIVVFTNQSKLWKHEQLQIVMNTLNIPIFIVVATEKSEYKPNRILFDTLLGNSVNTINKSQSFYVGDALGRKSDFADSDKIFAENIGIRVNPPEEIFHVSAHNETLEMPSIPLSTNPEIIIMMGYPGSGKSTIAKEICQNENYIYIEGDVYKTSAKMIKTALPHIKEKKSIVFDATHSSCKKRKEYIELAQKYNYDVMCIHVATSMEIAYKRNKLRPDEKQVPKIAYSVYTKHYETPTENEGFRLVVV